MRVTTGGETMGVAALCSSKFVASNAAVLLPSPLAIDLFVVTRSRGWSIRRRSCTKSFVCRAEAGEEEGRRRASEEVAVSVRYGAPGDRFRSPEFSDEFFSKMMEALEASHNATPRVYSDLREGGGSDSGTQGVDAAAAAACKEQLVLGLGGVQLPSSIKKRRRRGAADCAIRNAFASMVYMIKVVQSHALQIRQALFSEWDVQEVLLLVHREMHSSFVWLFQQVFSRTPMLMVSVMLLLANFTVYSTGANVTSEATTSTPAPIASFLSRNPQPAAARDHFISPEAPASPPRPHDVLDAAGAGGNSNNNSRPSSSGFDGDSSLHPRFMFSEKDVWTVKDLDVRLEQEMTRRLVAPVVAHLESDNYACFDRTDLEYQHAISLEPHNPLLLANYAHFLFVVRRDNDRAEGYFHQAMQADPVDATILGRFASFLWLARGNRSGAERAYKAAMAADPESSFPAGSYAHFLWHSGDGENSMR